MEQLAALNNLIRGRIYKRVVKWKKSLHIFEFSHVLSSVLNDRHAHTCSGSSLLSVAVESVISRWSSRPCWKNARTTRSSTRCLTRWPSSPCPLQPTGRGACLSRSWGTSTARRASKSRSKWAWREPFRRFECCKFKDGRFCLRTLKYSHVLLWLVRF